MIYEGSHECPEVIDCSEIVCKGGRVKGGIIHQKELVMDYYRYGRAHAHLEKNSPDIPEDIEIRVSVRSSKLPSIELFTLRNVRPADYRLVLVAIPEDRNNTASESV